MLTLADFHTVPEIPTKRHPSTADRILYKKSRKYKRAYVKTHPQFIAISNMGICLKWSIEDLEPYAFKRHAEYKLSHETECGITWEVFVTFRPNPLYKVRTTTYFIVTLPLTKDSKDEKRRRLFARQVRKITSVVKHLVRASKGMCTREILILYLESITNNIEELFKKRY